MSHLHNNRKRESGQHLRYSDRQLLEWRYRQNVKKPRHRRVRRTHKVPTGRQIEDLPAACDERKELGHWEMYYIESVKGDRTCILTLVDRLTREALLFKLTSQTQRAVIRAL